MDVLLRLLICSILNSIGGCQFKLDGEIEVRTQSNFLASLLSMYTSQRTLIVIIDDVSPQHMTILSEVISERQKRVMFSYQQIQTALVAVMENLMEHASLEKMRDQLQFLVICEVTCVEYIFTEVTNLDVVYGQGSLLRHFSTWLIISPDDLHPLNSSFDNVAWIRLKNDSIQHSFAEMNTLLWMPHGREWAKIPVSVNGKSFSYHTIFPNIENGLNGRELVISILEWTDYAIRKNVSDTVTYTGISMDIVNDLQKRFNFSYVTMEPYDNLWGQETEPGVFNGVLGVLQRKEAHLCPVPYGITFQRMLIMDFSSTIESMEYTIVYRNNRDDSSSWFVLASSYSWPVYLCGAASLLWVIFGLFCIDIQEVSTSMASRIMVFTWSLFCLLFTAVYISKLVSRSAVNKHLAPFNSIEELAENENYKIIIIEGLPVETFLKESDNLFHKKLYERLVVLQLRKNESFDVTMDKMLQEISSGTVVALATDSVKISLLSQNCDLSKMRFGLFATSQGIGFPKKSPLRRLFNSQLLNLVDTGLYRQYLKKWSPTPRECDSYLLLPQVTLNHLKSGLVGSGCGLILASFVLWLERRRRQ